MQELSDLIIEIIQARFELGIVDSNYGLSDFSNLLRIANKNELLFIYYFKAWNNGEIDYDNAYYFSHILRNKGQCDMAIIVLEKYLDSINYVTKNRNQYDFEAI